MIHALLNDDVFLAKFAMPQRITTQPQTDWRQLLAAAVQEPIMHPALADSVFAGDSVAIVIQNDLPYPREVLEAMVDLLADLKVAATDVSIVISKNTADTMAIDPAVYRMPEETKDEQPPIQFPIKFGFNVIVCQVHDSENDAGLAYLNANDDGEPIYVNRILADADVVIPIGCVQPGDDSRQTDCVYPAFGSLAAQQRFANSGATALACRSETAIANDMLGAFFVIRIVHGPGGEITDVFCGERQRTNTAARRQADQRWQLDFSGSAEIAVASIETEARRQTWDDVVQAVLTGSRMITENGPIIVLSELSKPPSRKIRQALQAQFDDGPEKKASAKLRLFADVVARRSVFLSSELTPSVVEDLGLGYLETSDQVHRVAEPFDQGVVIRDAHQCQLPNSESTATP